MAPGWCFKVLGFLNLGPTIIPLEEIDNNGHATLDWDDDDGDGGGGLGDGDEQDQIEQEQDHDQQQHQQDEEEEDVAPMPGYTAFPSSRQPSHRLDTTAVVFSNDIPSMASDPSAASNSNAIQSYAFAVNVIEPGLMPNSVKHYDPSHYAIVTITNMPSFSQDSELYRGPPITCPPPPPPFACQETYSYTLLPPLPPLSDLLCVRTVRKHSDLKWLHKALLINHPGAVVPPFPQRNLFEGFGSITAATRAMQLSEIQKWLQSVASHPVLCRSPLFVAVVTQSPDKFKDTVARFAKTPQSKFAEPSLTKKLTRPKPRSVHAQVPELLSFVEKLSIRENALQQLEQRLNTIKDHRTKIKLAEEALCNTVFEGRDIFLNFSSECNLPAFDAVSAQTEIQSKTLKTNLTKSLSVLDDTPAVLSAVKQAIQQSRDASDRYATASIALHEALEKEHAAPTNLPNAKREQLLHTIKDAENDLVQQKWAHDNIRALLEYDYVRTNQSLGAAVHNSLTSLAAEKTSHCRENLVGWQHILESIERNWEAADLFGVTSESWETAAARMRRTTVSVSESSSLLTAIATATTTTGVGGGGGETPMQRLSRDTPPTNSLQVSSSSSSITLQTEDSTEAQSPTPQHHVPQNPKVRTKKRGSHARVVENIPTSE
eukprot:c20748_g1_i22.p1 GENE.c20748_g1_i22~~c20748_g1_i22.p1  ORF type:complete len:658 (+),score=137.96 c20748_g1_i22:1355-3328(+)